MNLKNINLSTSDLFASLALAFQSSMRTAYLLSSCLHPERAQYLAEFLKGRPEIIQAKAFGSPKELFDFLKANQRAAIYFEDEILSKRVDYIRLLEGAICANDLGSPRLVSYEAESFVFTGKLLIASRLSKEELKKRVPLRYVMRDSVVM